MTITLTIGSLTFSSDPTVKLGISADSLQGWFSGPPVKTEPDDRANGDGVFGVTEFFRSARPITFSGLYTGTGDEAADFLVARQISGIFASGVPGTISVDDPAGTLTSEVMPISDAALVTPLLGGMCEYTISLLAFDPVRYGPTTTVSTGLPMSGGGLEYPLYSGGSGGTLYYGSNGNLGRVTLTNNGTADVWPTFTVTGQLDDGFYIQCLSGPDSGDVLRYDRVVPAGTTVSIDSRTGEVLVDGVSDASTYLTRDEFFSVPAMSSIDVQFNSISTSSGSPTMTPTVRDGWW